MNGQNSSDSNNSALIKLGFYGKIPSKGDFISRNLPRTFLDSWDQWLQESMAYCQEQLDDQWLNSYLTGPIWRFALSSGICGDHAWIGLVMPSVDQVGRYFPLTLALPVSISSELLFIVDKEEDWFIQAEDIALSALDQNNNLDDLIQSLDSLGIPEHLRFNPAQDQDNIDTPNLISQDNWRIAITESTSLSANLSSLTEQFILQRFPDYSLWWTSGSEQVEPSILICNKLPPVQGFSALLTANWDQWGWHNFVSNRLHTGVPKSENSTAVIP